MRHTYADVTAPPTLRHGISVTHVSYLRTRMTRALCRTVVAASVAVVLLALPACGDAPDITYVPQGGEYTTEQVEGLLDEADYSVASGITHEEAAEYRRQVLVALRGREDGSRVADLLTTGFPEATAAVPVRVERAEVQGKDAWFIWEAWGEERGTLDKRRLWVFDAETGMVMHAVSGD